MGEPDEDATKPGAEAADTAARATALLVDSIDLWAGALRRWVDPESTPTDREGLTAEVDRVLADLRPLVEAGAQLTVDALRPWAAAFQQRRGSAP